MSAHANDTVIGIMFEALGNANPEAAHKLREDFNRQPKAITSALLMAEMKRAYGMGQFGAKARCA